MELKPHDSRVSETGSLPREWVTRSVREFASIRTGPFGTLLKAAEYSGRDGVPLISVGEIGLGAFRISEETPLVPEVVVRRLPQYVLRAGDVVFGRKGAVERSALVGPDQEGWFLGSDGMSVRPGPGCHAPYLAFQFQSPQVQQWLLQNATGTTMASLNQEVLGRVAIPIAPLREQVAIAAALSDVDGLIGALDRLIAKKRELKQAAMQQLLTGQTRLPGFSSEWEDTTLGKIGECVIGLTYAPENVVEHGLLVLRSSNVQNNRLAFEDNVYVNLTVPEHLLTRSGDILVCVRNGSRSLIGKCALIDGRTEGLSFGAFMSMFRTRHWRFVFHAFQTHGIQRQIRENIGATINQITNKDMRALRIALPPEDEQNAIAEVLSDLDAELLVLEQRRDKTRLLRQGMMRELLTGRTRLT